MGGGKTSQWHVSFMLGKEVVPSFRSLIPKLSFLLVVEVVVDVVLFVVFFFFFS